MFLGCEAAQDAVWMNKKITEMNVAIDRKAYKKDTESNVHAMKKTLLSSSSFLDNLQDFYSLFYGLPQTVHEEDSYIEKTRWWDGLEAIACL